MRELRADEKVSELTAAAADAQAEAKPTTYINKQTFASATDYGEEF